MNNNQLAHIWANQTKENGKGNNMFFEGKKIYSYGTHYQIAELFEVKGKTVVFVNSNGYSNTTAKHTSIVCQACSHLEQFHIPFMKDFYSYSYRSKQYFEPNKQSIADFLLQIVNNHIYEQKQARTNGRYVEAAKREYRKYESFCNLFDLDPVKVDFSEVEEIAQKCVLRYEETEKKKAERAAKADAEKLQKWLTGEYNGTLYNIPVHFRIKNGKVQTTKGAYVSLEAAKRLYQMQKKGMDILGEKIDGFTVTKNDGNTVTISCHKIQMEIADIFFQNL